VALLLTKVRLVGFTLDKRKRGGGKHHRWNGYEKSWTWSSAGGGGGEAKRGRGSKGGKSNTKHMRKHESVVSRRVGKRTESRKKKQKEPKKLGCLIGTRRKKGWKPRSFLFPGEPSSRSKH